MAGAAILGALFSHKSYHTENRQYDQSQTGEFERGHNGGLYSGAYHDYSRSDAYSHGYEMGNEANLRGRGGRCGYAAYVQIDDLRDARAAGSMSELERRGFRQVENFTSGNTRYSI